MRVASVHKLAKPILLLVFLFLQACTLLGDSQDYPNGINEISGDYQINPDTILDELNKGEINVFSSMVATPSLDDELLPPGSFEWTQEDYLSISKALGQYVWKDDMADWSVYYISFEKDCLDEGDGFDSFDIIYYKAVKVDSENLYDTREINIRPLAKMVTWGSTSGYPRSFLSNWLNVDLRNFKVTADSALQIAENNGGKDARFRVNDSCLILVSSPYNNRNVWSVSYYGTSLFHTVVNPYNGKFNVFDEIQ
jgi:hypothetical protein